MGTSNVGKTNSASKYRDLNDPVKDLKAERNAKIAYIVAGAIVVLGAALLIYFTAANKMGHFTSTSQKYVAGHYEGWNWISSHYEPVKNSLIGANYVLYSVAAGGGVILVGVGISYDKEKQLHPWSPEHTGQTPETLANAVKTDTLEQAHARLYKQRNERVVNLGECVRRGHLTEAQVQEMDRVLSEFQAEVVKERGFQAEQAVFSRRWGGKSVEDLAKNGSCTDSPAINALAARLAEVTAKKATLESRWTSSKTVVFASPAASLNEADNDNL